MIERIFNDRYRLEGRLGEGGMAIVFSGFDTLLRRRVAIKVLRPQFAADEDFVRRFYDEAQHAAKLSHPNVVSIYDVGHEGDTYFIVMELVDGETLAAMLNDGRRLPERVAIDYATQICNGLAYAHRQGLLHRDIKPANILVTKDDIVKLSDFGIARAVSAQTVTITQPGVVMGSVFYLSPEQAQGRELHEQSDLYSLGVVLFQMLTGRLPYTGDSPIAIALKHVAEPIPPLEGEGESISPALARIVHRLLLKDPAARFASASEVAGALRAARENPAPPRPSAANGQGEADRAARAAKIPPRRSLFPDRSAEAKNARAARGLPAGAGAATAAVAGPGAQRSAIPLLLAALLAVASVVGYFIFSKPGGFFGKPVVVADFAGQTVADAGRTLEGVNLRYHISQEPSETVPLDRIIRQAPAPKSSIPQGTTIELYVSSGLPSVALSDVRNYTADDAQRLLRTAKLAPKIVEKFDKAAKGTVLAQDPAPGARLAERSIVTLTVSKGLAPTMAPDVVSMTVPDATAALQARGLKLEIGERAALDGVPENVVASQDPKAGAKIDVGGTVSVVVSAGPGNVTIPEVGGTNVSEAVTALGNAGLQPTFVYIVQVGTPSGTVLDEFPAGGTQKARGSQVRLSIAVPGTIPDVTGAALDAARTTLQNAGYRVGNVAITQQGDAGKVVRTEPEANATLHPGEAVTIYYNAPDSK
jgi:serine/threonine-protein kinase